MDPPTGTQTLLARVGEQGGPRPQGHPAPSPAAQGGQGQLLLLAAEGPAGEQEQEQHGPAGWSPCCYPNSPGYRGSQWPSL